MRDRKVFRDDFFYRLCSDVINVPPLRRRIEEKPTELEHLVEHLVTRMTADEAPKLVALMLETMHCNLGPRYAWPGNVRELEQAVRRILVTGRYEGDTRGVAPDLRSQLLAGLDGGSLDADSLLAGYCALLHQRHYTIEEVARRTNLDRRTVKRYLAMRERSEPDQ